MPEQSAGPLLDALGVTLDLGDNDQLTEALVICKVARFDDGGTLLVLGASEGLDWIASLGLLAAARQVSDLNPPVDPEDD